MVTNTGNVTLNDVSVTDSPVSPAGGVAATCESLSSPAGTCSGATTTLVPGQIATFSGVYAVTQADIDNGSVVDTATSQGTAPSGGTVDATSNTVTVTVAQSPSLSIVKSIGPTSITAAGQSVNYTFTVTNSGNLTLTDVGVTDVPTAPAGGVVATCESLSSPAGTCSGATTTLVPGQIATFTGVYTVTQADIDHGSIVDFSTTVGTTPSGGTVDATSNTVTVTETQSPSLAVSKSANPTTVTAAGQSVNYTFIVANTGNLTLTDVGVTDVPIKPGRRSHCDLPEPQLAGRDVFGRDHHSRPGPDRHLHRRLHRDPGRHRPRIDRRQRSGYGDHPLGHAGHRDLQPGYGNDVPSHPRCPSPSPPTPRR